MVPISMGFIATVPEDSVFGFATLKTEAFVRFYEFDLEYLVSLSPYTNLDFTAY